MTIRGSLGEKTLSTLESYPFFAPTIQADSLDRAELFSLLAVLAYGDGNDSLRERFGSKAPRLAYFSELLTYNQRCLEPMLGDGALELRLEGPDRSCLVRLGKFRGYSSVIPFESTTRDRYVEGTLSQFKLESSDVKSEPVCDGNEHHRTLYVQSVFKIQALLDQEGVSGELSATEVYPQQHLEQHLRSFVPENTPIIEVVDDHVVVLLAEGTTRDGVRKLKRAIDRLGGEILGSSADGHPIFSLCLRTAKTNHPIPFDGYFR